MLLIMIVTTARTPYMRKRKAAFLTVGRQKSQTTACDANHWKAMLQNIRLVWSQVVGSRIVGSRVVDCLSASCFSDNRLSACRFSAYCLPAFHLAASCLVLVAGRRVVGSVDSESLRPPLSEVRMREGCATKAVLCLTHLLLCRLPSLQHPAKLK